MWVRAFSTGSEDNGLHVGIDGEWPDSGQRLQWCEGKHTWRWESKQRTEKQHCGEAHKIFLDIKRPGEHVISFSMREDGFEFDKWLMTLDRDFKRPNDIGPKSLVYAGTAPKEFRFVKAQKTPPKIAKMQATPDHTVPKLPRVLVMSAKGFTLDGTGFYLDKGQWAAINPDQRKKATAGATFAFPTGKYNVTLLAVGENDGRSKYGVTIDAESVGSFQAPLSKQMYEEGSAYQKTFNNVSITEGAVVKVTAEIGSEDGAEFSRARWSGVSFEPADAATKKLAAPLLKNQAAVVHAASQKDKRAASPTKPVSALPLILPRQPDGNGAMGVSGELKQWHTFTLTLNGPYAHEQDNAPNPFTDYRMQVTFTHTDGTSYNVPGYFAADGNAANSSAQSGTKWRVNFVPDRTGSWNYKVDFRKGKGVALDPELAGDVVTLVNGKSGSIKLTDSNKSGRDLRAHGRLQYVGKHYLQFGGSKKFFLKAGADAPETMLGYADFDDTIANKPKVPLKTWSPHIGDWQNGDPTWKNGKGKGLIGAINYLSGKGCNAFSFLTYNAGGDGDNVWPFIHRDDKLHYDCSKLDQWGIVFDHGTQKGMYLHFKMQETENDDHKRHKAAGGVPECLDNGDLGPQRRLYCRELIARFGHNLALNWNLGEENTQSTAQQQAMIDFIAATDPYGHNIVVHTFPNDQDKVYGNLLGDKSKLTGVSLQNSNIKDTHHQTVKWVRKSSMANKPWIVAFDESGTAAHGQCPDLGYKGFDGKDKTGKMIYTEHEVRRQTLWGTLMGGGAGVEYYFGYQFVENDLLCEDWRSRDRSWNYCRIAIDCFHDNSIPFQDMQPADQLVGNHANDNSRYCFAKSGDTYLVYLPYGGTTDLDLSGTTGNFSVDWFNPRTGGKLVAGTAIAGGQNVSIGDAPDKEDWLAIIRRAKE